jgi:hypothetical protein
MILIFEILGSNSMPHPFLAGAGTAPHPFEQLPSMVEGKEVPRGRREERCHAAGCKEEWKEPTAKKKGGGGWVPAPAVRKKGRACREEEQKGYRAAGP